MATRRMDMEEILEVQTRMNASPSHASIEQAIERAYAALPPAEAANHRWLANTYRTVIRALVAQIGDVSGKTIIDVGAGRGIVSLALRFLGAEVTACERFVFEQDRTDMFHSSEAQGILDAWQAAGIHPLIGDVYDLERLCGDVRFDAAVSIQVIEHLPSPKRMLDGIHMILKPGGALVLTAPNYGRLRARMRLLVGLNPKIDLKEFYFKGAEGFVGHWREFFPYEIRQMLAWSGFQETRAFTFVDASYAWRKNKSFIAMKDYLIDSISKMIPNAQYELLSVSVKKRT